MAGAIGVMVVCALTPAKWMRWANALGNRASMVIAPVKGPVWALVNWVSPVEAPKPEAIRTLENERDKWKQLYAKARMDLDDVQKKFEQLSHGSLYPDLPIRQLPRPVIGFSTEGGGQLEVRAGTRDGVDLSAVATTESVQLVGKVVRAATRSCWVRLITDSSGGTIDGVIMSGDEVRGPRCQNLFPVAGRKLQARVRVEKGQTPPEAGQLVRLADDRWPRSSQMLVIGAISDKPEPDSMGWYIVTVKPTVDLERLSEVVVRVALPEPDEKGPPPSTDGKGP